MGLILLVICAGCGKSNDNGRASAVAAQPMGPTPLRGGSEYDDSEQPGDVYAVSPMGGHRYNASRELRRQLRAAELLVKMAKALKTKTPDELVDMFEAAGFMTFMNPTGVRYFLLREGNRLIEAELARRRGPAARRTLRRCSADHRYLFTGSAGPPRQVSGVCRRLLRRLDAKPPRRE